MSATFSDAVIIRKVPFHITIDLIENYCEVASPTFPTDRFTLFHPDPTAFPPSGLLVFKYGRGSTYVRLTCDPVKHIYRRYHHGTIDRVEPPIVLSLIFVAVKQKLYHVLEAIERAQKKETAR